MILISLYSEVAGAHVSDIAHRLTFVPPGHVLRRRVPRRTSMPKTLQCPPLPLGIIPRIEADHLAIGRPLNIYDLAHRQFWVTSQDESRQTDPERATEYADTLRIDFRQPNNVLYRRPETILACETIAFSSPSLRGSSGVPSPHP